ncbi:MAG: glycosyltransferase family 4 protein [Oscillospiraceae bacterium]|nr:glycosyltransferase family 4 protein [Oscillospiraceae bacterium]
MKILILANHDDGLYHFRKELLERLIAEGHTVYVSVPNGSRMGLLTAMGCRQIDTPLNRRGTNPIQDLSLLRQYHVILRTVQPELVLTYTIKPNIYGGMACAGANIPYVENITGLGTALETPGVLQTLTALLYRIALRRVQTVFFQNTENEQFFERRHLAPGKHALLPGSGVNLAQFSVLPYPDTEEIGFVMIARVMKEKGIEQYLDAAREIRARQPQTRFHICGACEQAYEEKIQALAAQGIVLYHGNVSDVREVLRTVECTVHPTYYPEGMSNVLLESCASGRAIITTDRSGCREIVNDGVNGYICKQQDSADLILQIEKFLSLDKAQRKSMGLAGRAKVEQTFDRQIVVEAYLQEIAKLRAEQPVCEKSAE